MASTPLEQEDAVRARYARAAGEREQELCCPVNYDPRYLAAIPAEILDRDYGCGDPSRHVRPGETVLDLGSGGGKICYIAAQIVGAAGHVIGVDMNDEMLALAERHRHAIGERLGYHNVTFHKSRIQDLQPVIANDSVDVVVSNCVLNLVPAADKPRLFDEIHRVLRSNGRAVVSDIVASVDVPAELQQDPTLWSGCVSGALREDRFLAAFGRAGFPDVRMLQRADEPWQVVAGIEFRSITVEAAMSPGASRGSCC
jgi:arsenite methyltransferase